MVQERTSVSVDCFTSNKFNVLRNSTISSVQAVMVTGQDFDMRWFTWDKNNMILLKAIWIKGVKILLKNKSSLMINVNTF